MKSLSHPVLRILGIAVAIALGLRALFFRLAPWLWSKESPLDSRLFTPWTRWALSERDGIEPYALLLMVLVACVATLLISLLTERLPQRLRLVVAALSLPALLGLAWYAPFRPPLHVLASTTGRALVVVAASLLAAGLFVWSTRGERALPVWAALVLALACFLPTTGVSRFDIETIFAPALSLLRGAHLRDIYCQYDLLLSLLALFWLKIDASPLAFSVVGGLGYFLFLLGLCLIARHWLLRRELVGPLLVCVVIVRVYAAMHDSSALPQVTPWRLDLWIVPLALTLFAGLDHWIVGLGLALLCLFCRSFGILYLGAFALAWGADFLAARSAEAGKSQPLLAALRAAVRRVLPVLGLVVLSFAVGRLIFGSLTSEAAVLYRHLGIGMTRIARASFYWWLLPLNCTVVALVFWRRNSLPAKQRQASLFLCALAVANSIYFFGRSHEHNLINISAIFLVLFFLAIDLVSGLPETREVSLMRRLLQILPWATVGFCAYFYAGQVVTKVQAQAALVGTHQDLAAAGPTDFAPNIDCREIANVVGHTKILYFSSFDFYFNWQCRSNPVGRYQPMMLAPLKEPLIEQVNHYLADGYTVVVPKQGRDWSQDFKREFLPGLGQPLLVETPKYLIYRRP